ncbi:MAG: aspartate ammonia-lyase [Mycobacterium sp.]
MSAPHPQVTRTERDSLGAVEIPADAYFGVHTARALTNFQITGTTVGHYPEFVTAIAAVKEAAATSNITLQLLDPTVGSAIVAACRQIRTGAHHDQFVVDPIQGGAGTSTNMNANEVIANVALGILGRPPGDYAVVHPLNHVNLCQSTNDVYPTAIKLALDRYLEDLSTAMRRLEASFARKALEFKDILKIGRTQLQDAVPMTLGQEFGTFAVMLAEDQARIDESRSLLQELNLGGTAIGTSLNAPSDYPRIVVAELRAIIGNAALVSASDLVEATQDTGVFVHTSGILKRVAIKLSKICNDLRLLSSGPRTGLGEIQLPPRQAGSSIMPGKVNPVIPEVVNQIAFDVIGKDTTISFAAEAGQLQLNAFEPMIAKSLFDSIIRLTAGCRTLADNCIDGIAADRSRLDHLVASSAALATALVPEIGYDAAARIAGLALDGDRRVLDLAVESGLVDPGRLAELLDPRRVAGLGAAAPSN